MKIEQMQGQVSRIAFYDRGHNLVVTSAYLLGIAPHVSTERWSYTVPAETIGRVGHAFVSTMRQNTGSSSNRSTVTISVTPSGGSELVVLNQALRANTLGEFGNAELADGMYLDAGDNMICDTVDATSGGECDYLGVIGVDEFDEN